MKSENYKKLIEVIIPLNHDRYKSYFVHFFAVQVAIFAGIANDFTKELSGSRITLIVVGIITAAIWFFVQRKISYDIRNVWEMLSKFENGEDFDDQIKVSDTPSKNYTPASMLMLTVPLGCIIVHLALLLKI